MMNQQRSAFAEGDIVRMLAGPFAGLRATIEAISEDQRLLRVILRFFGQKQTVEVFLMDVEKIA
jgi:transcription antitermination factor NusG